jgi:hypothetical protein
VADGFGCADDCWAGSYCREDSKDHGDVVLRLGGDGEMNREAKYRLIERKDTYLRPRVPDCRDFLLVSHPLPFRACNMTNGICWMIRVLRQIVDQGAADMEPHEALTASS